MSLKTAQQVLAAFDGIRRAQNDGRYAPHKPLLILLALARVQRGDQRMAAFTELEPRLKALLMAFGPSNSADRRHLPFWHLGTDKQGELWQRVGPQSLLLRPAGATPTLGELRQDGVRAGFAPDIFDALRQTPGLVQEVARRVLDAYFPETLRADIVAATGLDLESVPEVRTPATSATYPTSGRPARDPRFRDHVLRAYEFRCCVCGFDLRIGHLPAGLEAAHIQWHHVGGPDIETNGLSLCALHHKLFDLGAFTIEPVERRVVFSQHATGGHRGKDGVLMHHGQPMFAPQDQSFGPDRQFLDWNRTNVFKTPGRRWD